jgi:hypothetical protein
MMNIRILAIGLLVILLAGCASAVQQADEVVRVIGDDVLRIVSRNGDEIAQTARQYTDDVSHQVQHLDEATRYWDDVNLASRAVDDSAQVLLYQSQRLSPLQDDVIRSLRDEADLSENEALLYLQTVCAVTEYVKIYNEYPETASAQIYAERVAARNGIDVFAIADFAESAIQFVSGLIEEDPNYTRQDVAGFLFEALCLISDVQ